MENDDAATICNSNWGLKKHPFRLAIHGRSMLQGEVNQSFLLVKPHEYHSYINL